MQDSASESNISAAATIAEKASAAGGREGLSARSGGRYSALSFIDGGISKGQQKSRKGQQEVLGYWGRLAIYKHAWHNSDEVMQPCTYHFP
jgi:hypothetical protein